MIRIRIAGLAAAVSMVILAAPVAADTFEGPRGDRIVAGASFDFVEGGLTYSAGADVISDLLAGTIRISASYFTSSPVTCLGEDPDDPSDDYEASIETGFSADAPVVSSAFGTKLSSATASGTVSGDIARFDPCTQTSDVVGHDTIDVSIALVATGPVQSNVTHNVGIDEEGNRFVFISRSSERPASGNITFDGVEYPAGGVISSQWWRTPVGG